MKSTFLLLTIATMFAAPLAARAQSPGDLLVTPTRVVFDDGKRFETLTLINHGSDSATYRISVIQYRMTHEGNLERIDSADPGQLVATDMIRFFPREVTIAPGETQNVRVQMRVPDNIGAGEYRSHLFFRSVPKANPLLPTADTSKNEFAVKLSAVFGVSVPIILRKGALTAAVQLSNVDVKPGNGKGHPILAMTFHRDGTESVCGTVRVTFVPASGESVKIASVGGVAIYTPNTERTFRMPLNIPADVDLTKGRLRVDYESLTGASPETLASAETIVH